MAIYARHLGMALDHDLITLDADRLSGLGPGGVAGDFHAGQRPDAQKLTQKGVLPTRLSAVHEAATMDVLCSDKTGTLTQNLCTVREVPPMPGFRRRKPF